MSTITLIAEINCNTHDAVIECFGAGGYGKSHRSVDECHLSITTDNVRLERAFLATTIAALLSIRIPFTIEY